MKNDNLPELLKKYLAGKSTPEETGQVEQWYITLQENPDDVGLLDPLELDIVQNRILSRIKANIEVPDRQPAVQKVGKSFFLRTPFQLAAAITAIAVIGLGAIFFLKEKGLPSIQRMGIATHEHLKEAANETSAIRRLMLEDGTVITLQPNSSVEYPEKFSSSERNVVLRGEAFFDVAKDKNRPFYIHASDVTVKVLGTSFNVVAYEGAGQISVAVKTGRVSVYAKNKRTVLHQMRANDEVILTPNQEAIYNREEEYFSKKLVDKPQIVLEKPTLFETEYDGAPVVKILDVLEENYGIDIQYDPQALSDCVLTTSMAEEGLYERIEIICKAIGAQYEISETSIKITSQGCH